jgi:dTDP-4-amino-4,6-dideoxygalactose transaminase
MKVALLDYKAQYAPIREEILKVVTEVFDQPFQVLGPYVDKFEKSLAAYCGTKYALGVTSGTDALLCALMSIGIKPGDEVLCPTFTFFATAGGIARVGAKPVFVDIEPATFNIDVNQIENKITPKTRAIIPVDLFGQLANLEAINQIATKHDLKVIEDAAQAIGAKRNGKRACSDVFGGCLSFYPTKNLGAHGDGGAICTNDQSFYETCKLLRIHGSGHTYNHKIIGGMFRMSAVQGAILDVKLKHLESWHEGRRRNAAEYNRLFAGSKITLPVIDPANWSIFNQYVVRIQDRDRVKQTLADKGIPSGVYYPIPLHLQECFAYLGYKPGDFPQAERACREVLALPIYPELPSEHLQYVAKELLAAVG